MLKLAKVLWSQKLLIAAAFAERLDEFIEIADCDEQKGEYYTVHGERTFSFACPEVNEFYIFKTGDGFAKALGVPCDLERTNQIPQSIVEYVELDAKKAGYAKAVKLPYYIADRFAAKSIGAIVVNYRDNNWEAVDAGQLKRCFNRKELKRILKYGDKQNSNRNQIHKRKLGRATLD